ncbi:MAG: SDR family NAD(P)-dependent oxidoreductase [Syntrophothermus sp.]
MISNNRRLKKNNPGDFFEKFCYICHNEIISAHFSNPKLCDKCGELNYHKRSETADLNGRVALVTGGRIKIGYETSLKLLRSGAFVIVTTRFPIDAAFRYSQENDFSNWQKRLKIYKIDFRNILQIELFAKFLSSNLPHLDIIINNAAQTIKRPTDYYEHLRPIESKIINELPCDVRQLIYDPPIDFDFFQLQKSIDFFDVGRIFNVKMLLPNFGNDGAAISEHADEILQTGSIEKNSWNSKAHDVSAIELLEVQLVNVTAPFLLNTHLKSLLLKSPFSERFIINVSAMEGKFNRIKNSFHPHTNMAKASLNMLTRTSGQEYKNDGIFMNSVDTGWITDENPRAIQNNNQQRKIVPPLDEIDGASRILDPIFHGLKTQKFSYGRFFKDYHLTNW